LWNDVLWNDVLWNDVLWNDVLWNLPLVGTENIITKLSSVILLAQNIITILLNNLIYW